MESMAITADFWQGKKVLITGHTGFKGSWLALWLQQLGANVVGFALDPPTKANLFEKARVAEGMCSIHGDIRHLEDLRQVFLEHRPQIVFHLAAQSLVRESYLKPVETYQTNVMGTLHVLEAIRACPDVKAAVIVTTDKCYENQEWLWPYRENEPMGGHDPYSSSKGCAELLIASYRQSFFSGASQPAIASARAGNVIGGGDWATDRLIPDILNAFVTHQIVKIRNPDSVRPWQFVLEPLAGYLILAQQLYLTGHAYAEAWNFGAMPDDAKPVRWIVEKLCSLWQGGQWENDTAETVHEARLLKLDSTKARERLGWHARYSLGETLEKIVTWHEQALSGEDMRTICNQTIVDYAKRINQGKNQCV